MMTPVAAKVEAGREQQVTNYNWVEGADRWLQQIHRSVMMDDFVCKGYKKNNRKVTGMFDL
jgi:hypothetical protein